MTQWKVQIEAGYREYTKLFDDPNTAVGVARNLMGFADTDGKEAIKVSVEAVLDEEDDF